MQLKMYSVYDSKSGAFMPIMFYRANGEALRAFASAINTPDHLFNKHPGDFTLFFLGQWHDGSSAFEIEPTPINLGIAQEFLNKE